MSRRYTEPVSEKKPKKASKKKSGKVKKDAGTKKGN